MGRNNDQNVGECLTSINGQFFCYVSPSSGCSDMKWSSRSTPDNELWYSFDACSGPKVVAAEMSDTDGWPRPPFEPIAPTISDCGCASIEVYHNGPLEYTHKSIYGYYVRQEDLINEGPWFKNNGKSIWWDTKYWRLGWTNRTGGQHSHAKLYNDERCLTKISDQEWNLYDSNANWSNAGNKLRIRCGYKPKGYGTSCCSKIKLSLKGAALNEQGRLAGIYDRENELVNGRNLWRSQTDNDAIWFTKEMNYWSIGHIVIEALTMVASGVLKIHLVPTNKACYSYIIMDMQLVGITSWLQMIQFQLNAGPPEVMMEVTVNLVPKNCVLDVKKLKNI